MVAYNFKTAFHDRIIDRTKRQTVRHQGGKRHARPGELVQLYAGMRTKAAHKLIEDQLCLGVDQIVIPVGRTFETNVGRLEINGVPLTNEQMAAFAVADGFPSLTHFGRFWLMTHGKGTFEGVVIRW